MVDLDSIVVEMPHSADKGKTQKNRRIKVKYISALASNRVGSSSSLVSPETFYNRTTEFRSDVFALSVVFYAIFTGIDVEKIRNLWNINKGS